VKKRGKKERSPWNPPIKGSKKNKHTYCAKEGMFCDADVMRGERRPARSPEKRIKKRDTSLREKGKRRLLPQLKSNGGEGGRPLQSI